MSVPQPNPDELSPWHEPYVNDIINPEFFPSLHVWGRTFSPRRIAKEAGIRFAAANEPGEINVAGPSKGRPLGFGMNFGTGIIRPPEAVPPEERIHWMLTKILAG